MTDLVTDLVVDSQCRHKMVRAGKDFQFRLYQQQGEWILTVCQRG